MGTWRERVCVSERECERERENNKVIIYYIIVTIIYKKGRYYSLDTRCRERENTSDLFKEI